MAQAVLEETTTKSLIWYAGSGIIGTDSHQRILLDAADIIANMSSGRKLWHRQDSQIPDTTSYYMKGL